LSLHVLLLTTTATNTDNGQGGAIIGYLDTVLKLRDVVVRNTQAASSGGAVCTYGKLFCTGCRFYNSTGAYVLIS
jgi:hypothetical protein